MRKKRIWGQAVFLFGLMVVVACAAVVIDVPKSVSAGSPDESSQQKQQIAAAAPEGEGGAPGANNAAYIEKVILEKKEGKERLVLQVSKLSGYTASKESPDTVVVRLSNVFVPEDVKKRTGNDSLQVIDYVLPSQETVDGAMNAQFKIMLKGNTPYRVYDDGKSVFVDFDQIAAVSPSAEDNAEKGRVLIKKSENGPNDLKHAASGDVKKYTGPRFTFEFQDTNLKHVLRSIAEVSGVSIVAGEDVKGKVTMSLKGVSWEQALDTITDLYGLDQRRIGEVITIMSADKLKKVQEKRQMEKEAAGGLRQISIEAKIVEATESFGRNLGVAWGAGAKGSWNGTDVGFITGTGGVVTGATTAATTLPSGVGWTTNNLAANFPYSVADTPTVGVLLGTSKWVLDAQLSALEASSEGKVISSPKVTTMENVKATIKQGDEIPYVIESVSGGAVTRTVQFKDAVLQLDCKPSITPDGRISMQIHATNNSPDYVNMVQGNPPIKKSEVDSSIVVRDGDTIVVGGILKEDKTTSKNGVPWLKDIPVLGWLFKAEDITKTKREILIFITPKIIKDTTGA
jgi:type IV pilus assembly protein PilQ